jgi:hypothetical protein
VKQSLKSIQELTESFMQQAIHMRRPALLCSRVDVVLSCLTSQWNIHGSATAEKKQWRLS